MFNCYGSHSISPSGANPLEGIGIKLLPYVQHLQTNEKLLLVFVSHLIPLFRAQ